MGLVSTTHTKSKATPINDNNYSCHNYNCCRTCLTNRMESISCHITPLVINSLGSGHTHTHTHTQTQTKTQTQTHTHIDVHTETILRNQVHTRRRPARAWFKNITHFLSLYYTIQLETCK